MPSLSSQTRLACAIARGLAARRRSFAANAFSSLAPADEAALRRIRNLGVSAHIDAGKTTCTERMLLFAGAIARAGEVHDGTTVTDFLPQERERGITIKAAAISFAWPPPPAAPALPPKQATPGDAGSAGDGGARDEAAATSAPPSALSLARGAPPFTLNLIDTPGHVDFTMEVERSMRVLDGAVLLFDAVSGVEAQSETVFLQATRHDVAKIAFANKMDREGAGLELVARSMRARLGVEPLALHLPLGEAGAFAGVVDLVTLDLRAHAAPDGRALWRRPLAGLARLAPGARVAVPARSDGDGALSLAAHDVLEAALAARATLLERLAEADDAFADAYLAALDRGREGGGAGAGGGGGASALARAADGALNHALDISRPGLSAGDVTAALRRVVCAPRARHVPLLCGSAYKNKGVQSLLDAACALLPSPLDRPPVFGARAPSFARSGTGAGAGAGAGGGSSKGAKAGGGGRAGAATPAVDADADAGGAADGEGDAASSALALTEPVAPSPDAPLRALCFKVQPSRERGALCFFRVYSGVVTRAQPLLNASTGARERPSRLLQLFADEVREVESVACGHIGAASGLKGVRTGDTLCVAGDPSPLVLARVARPRPVFSASVELDSDAGPGSAEAQRGLDAALALLLREDPSLRSRVDADTGQTLLDGMGELHLDIALDRLRREHGVPARLGRVRVAYRETVAAEAEADVTYDRAAPGGAGGGAGAGAAAGGRRLWCRLALRVEPLPPTAAEAAVGAEASSAPCEFAQADGPIMCRVVGPDGAAAGGGDEGTDGEGEGEGAAPLRPLPPPLADALRESVWAGLGRGAVLGSPLVGLRVSLDEARTQLLSLADAGAAAAALRACAARALAQAVREAGPLLLEPVMAVEVVVPEALVGDVIGDLTSARRGTIRDVRGGVAAGGAGEGEGAGAAGGPAAAAAAAHAGALHRGRATVAAVVPLRAMVGYSTSLRSRTGGEGGFSMELLRYDHVGAAQQRQIASNPSLA